MKVLVTTFPTLAALIVCGSLSLSAQTPTLPLSTPATGALTLGEDFCVGLRYDGVARSWGSNAVGELGTNATVATLQATPTQLRISSSTALTAVARIYAGRQHGLAITTAASSVLRAWGRNDSGQLGDGSTTNRIICVTATMTNAVAAAAGYSHSLALKSDGTVWGWGSNASGQVGNNSTSNALSPVRVTPASPVFPNTFKAVAAGYDHSLALRNDGTVWAWGGNTYGQLGTGDTTLSRVPVQVQNLPGGLTVSAIGAGDGFSVVLLSDGTIRAWGRANQGQLGNESDVDSLVPVQPIGLGTDNTTLAMGDSHVLVRKTDGSVWGWGSNLQGELGGLVPAAQFTPQVISGLSNVAVIAAGTARSGAVLSDGAILVWGDPATSALGPASRGYNSTRIQLSDVKLAAGLHAGGDQAAVVRTTNRAYLFGRNADGQLGVGNLDPVAAPQRVLAWPATYTSTAPSYAFGASHALALIDGVVCASGANDYGQLGDGTSSAKPEPVTLSIAGSAITQVSAGWYHSLARRADGTVLAWGRNDAAQLGFGASSSTPTLTPTTIPGLTNVVAVAAGEAHSLALKADGTVWAWGSNIHGQTVGTGTTAITTPTQVSGPTYIIAIAAGANHSLALVGSSHPTTASRNRVYAWGRGDYGQIGNGASTARVTTPAFLSTTGLVGIAAGANHSLARKSDGTVLAWGRNNRGQVGNAYTATLDADTTAKVLSPTAVTSITTTSAVSAIAAGFNSSYAVFGNGTAFGWGDAANQQLGYVPSRFTPIAWRLTNNSADADADGMLNAWETAKFGSTTTKAGYDDTDTDGLLDIQEHYYASTPANYPSGTVGSDTDGDLLNDFADSDLVSPANGNSYTLSIVAGNAQFVTAGETSPLAVTVQAKLTTGASVGASLPVYVTAQDSDVRLGTASLVPPSAPSSLNLASNTDGVASFYYRQKDPAGPSIVTFKIGAEVGEVYVFPPLSGGESPATADSDGDGIPDVWEISIFGSLRDQTGAGNPDGDAYSNAWEWLLGTNPLSALQSVTMEQITVKIYSP